MVENSATEAPSLAGDFQVGRVISRAFETLKAHAGVFLLLALLMSALPSAAASWLGRDLQTTSSFNPLDTIVNISFGVICTGAMTFAALQAMKGQAITLGSTLSVGVSQWPGMLGVSMLSGLGMVLGLIVLIVPGVLLMIVWSVATPARIADGPGVTAALSRSFALTKGFRLKIFALLAIGFAITAVAMVLSLAIGAVAFGMESLGIDIVVALVLGMVLPLMTNIGAASIYQELIAIKEGGGVETTASTFD